MKKRVLGTLFAAMMATVVMAGCASSGGGEAEVSVSEASSYGSELQVVKIGVRADLVDTTDAIKDAAAAAGYELDVTVFDDSIQPNVALEEGSIDINFYQHEPYLLSYNAENGTDFVMVEPKTYMPLFAMYSSKWTAIDEIPEGATIGLCNDATNQARGLKLLQSQGLITLDDSVDVPTQYDVKDNPKNLKFIEAEMSVLPQSIEDVDAICLAGTHMVNAGMDASGYICTSDDMEDYGVGFVVRAEDADAQWAKDIAKAAQCDELADVLEADKQGTMLPMWK